MLIAALGSALLLGCAGPDPASGEAGSDTGSGVDPGAASDEHADPDEDAEPDAGADEGGTGEGVDYAIALHERECPFSVPADRSADCYTLIVPLDRTQPERGEVELPVAVLHPPGPSTRPPALFLHGGPGGHAVASGKFWLSSPLAEDGELVLFDQRGSGLAEPSLDCPELAPAWFAALASTEAPAQELAILREGYAACRARLHEELELDLDAFDTTTSAADVEDLRRALGYPRWSLYGVSYGTRLALEVMRQHGASVRNVVLDSAYPPQIGGVVWMVANAGEALARLIAGCEAEPACAQSFPALASKLELAVARLDAEPYLVELVDGQGEVHELRLTGADLYAGLYNALYDVEAVGLVPLLITLAAQGDYGFLPELAARSIPHLTNLAEGARVSVDCADAGALLDPLALADAIEQHPRYATLFAAHALPYCEDWAVAPSSAGFNEPVVSAIPTLLLAGEYDPVTPPTQTQLAAASLSEAQTYVLPGFGHAVTYVSGCAMQMAREFLRDSSCDPSCWAALPDATF